MPQGLRFLRGRAVGAARRGAPACRALQPVNLIDNNNQLGIRISYQ
jgi:hypothetical protein